MSSRRLLPLIPFLLSLANFAPALAQTDTAQRNVFDSTSKPASPEEHGPYYALIIGINDYRYLTKLNTPVDDANAVAKALREQYGFETTVLPNATRYEILTALDNYRRTLSDNANLLIYYAGHGQYDEATKKAYWLPVDAETNTYADWIIADDITSRIRAIPARHVLVVSDSCFSGALRSGEGTVAEFQSDVYIQRMLADSSTDLMASGGKEPVVDEGCPGHSAFACAFLRGLGRTDKNAFTALDLFASFIQPNVVEESSTGQKPQYGHLPQAGRGYGDFVFFRSHAGKPTIPNRPGGNKGTPLGNGVERRVKQLIAVQLGKDEASVTPSARLVEDLGADNLDLIELVTAFEETFEFEMPDDDRKRIHTVQDAIQYIQAHAKSAKN